MTEPLHITLAQINPIVGDLGYNLDKIRAVRDSTPEETDIIVFPELAICGYSPEDMTTNGAFLRAVDNHIRILVKESAAHKPWLIVGAPKHSRGKIYNAAYVIGDGKTQATIRKHHLPNYGVFDEVRVFYPGPLPAPFEYKGRRIGLMICEDTWFNEPAAKLKEKGAELLISINASPYETGKQERRRDTVAARVRETGLPLIYVNQQGGQDDIVFDGASFVMNENGKVIAQAKSFAEDTIHTIWEKTVPVWRCRPAPIAPALPAPEMMYEAAKIGLQDYVHKNGFPGVLLGLSGGVDSALVATIAIDALGPEAVHGVFMPSKYTSQESKDDAAALAKNLDIRIDTVSIEDTVATLEKTLAPHFTAQTPDITFQNLQSRARGVILMALSNASGKMLLSTGNKSEVAAGYATLYGDMCGGYNPLKDIYKTEVYELARWRNGKNPVIPERSITRAPTAELKPGQTDQDTLPPYETLDAILRCLIERDMGVDETAAEGHNRATVVKVARMLDISEYKRRQATPGPKISTRAFARERRYPMTNKFRAPSKKQ